VRGEQWSAQSVEGPIAEGSPIEVVGVEGLTLKVRKKAQGANNEYRTPNDE